MTAISTTPVLLVASPSSRKTLTNQGSGPIYFGRSVSVSRREHDALLNENESVTFEANSWIISSSSGSLYALTDAPSISPVVEPGLTLPTWAAHTYFAAGQVVVQGTGIYQAIDSHTSGSTFSADLSAHWTALSLPNASSGGAKLWVVGAGMPLADEPLIVCMRDPHDETIESVNVRQDEVAADFDHVIVADIADANSAELGLNFDAVHPNEKGTDYIATQVVDAILDAEPTWRAGLNQLTQFI